MHKGNLKTAAAGQGAGVALQAWPRCWHRWRLPWSGVRPWPPLLVCAGEPPSASLVWSFQLAFEVPSLTRRVSCDSALCILKCDIKRCLVIFDFFHFSITVDIQCYLVSAAHLDPTYMCCKAITPVSLTHAQRCSPITPFPQWSDEGWKWTDYDVIKRPLAFLLWPSREMGRYSSQCAWASDHMMHHLFSRETQNHRLLRSRLPLVMGP